MLCLADERAAGEVAWCGEAEDELELRGIVCEVIGAPGALEVLGHLLCDDRYGKSQTSDAKDAGEINFLTPT